MLEKPSGTHTRSKRLCGRGSVHRDTRATPWAWVSACSLECDPAIGVSGPLQRREASPHGVSNLCESECKPPARPTGNYSKNWATAMIRRRVASRASRPANPGFTVNASWSREVPFAHLLQTRLRSHRRHGQDEGQCGSVSPSAADGDSSWPVYCRERLPGGHAERSKRSLCRSPRESLRYELPIVHVRVHWGRSA